MRVVFVRHAIALERYEWSDDDLLRPLSEKGVSVAKEFFSFIKPLLDDYDTIISSKASRALHTADLLIDALGVKEYQTSSLLNPGCSIDEVKKLLSPLKDCKKVVLVGHEPDFSEIVSSMTSDSIVALKLKKPSLAVVNLKDGFKGELELLLSPKATSLCS